MTSDTIIERQGGLARFVLNRPKAHNALTHDQVLLLADRLAAWEGDSGVVAVVIEGDGHKSFCAGGDIRALYDHVTAGRVDVVPSFFGDEYRLNRQINIYSKPYVALLDGIVMGGGAGVSINGRYRVATERTLFAMPETAIGFYPDVGGTYFLPRLPGATGLYLALTGNRLHAADTYHTGLATHYVHSAELDALRTALAAAADAEGIAAVLDRFHRDPGPSPLAEKQWVIDRTFGKETLPEILAALEADENPWARHALAVIRSRSPSAVVVAFTAARQGRGLDFDACLRLEYRLSLQVALTRDFIEGIRAVIVDKDQAPRWSPAQIESVSAEIYALHETVPAEGDLTF